MSDLNSKQALLLQEALERRQKSLKSSGMIKDKNAKPKITPEEYARRLNAQIASDSEIASTMKKERIDSALKEWDILVGPRFARAKIDDPEVAKKVNTRVRRIVNGGPLHRNSLVLIGHLGTGKTWTGYAYARQLISEGVLQPGEVLFGTEIGLLTPLALATFDRTEKINDFLNPQHKFYFIDEVGRATFKTPELQHEIWYAIINHAYENHIPVILTTNKSTSPKQVRNTQSNKSYSNELEAWLGEAAYDRLKYMADDGVIIPGSTNKRKEVNESLDGEYKDDAQEPTPAQKPVRKSTPPSSQKPAKKVLNIPEDNSPF